MLPVVLTIAGSDNSAGAGAQADLKTISALNAYATTAITCVVAEVPGKVSAIQPVAPEVVAEQIRLIFEAFPVAAVKTGMLYSREIIAAVCATLGECFARADTRPPLVVDPVMVATSGDPLLQADAVSLYRTQLIPLSRIITPNLDEVRTLLGRSVSSVEQMRLAGRDLARLCGTAVLVKGGHLREAQAVDVLIDGEDECAFSAPFVPEVSTHGTGCTYSAAIAAGLAQGRPLHDAVEQAKRYVTSAISQYLRWEGHGGAVDALRHFPIARGG